MRWLLTAILCLLPIASKADTGLIFPVNADAPASSMVAFRWDDPRSNGLPMWGTGSGNSRSGVTYMWEVNFSSDAFGYATTMFYSRCDGYFDQPGDEDFYGFHPYPQEDPKLTDLDHNWETSTRTGDDQITDGGGELAVVDDTWFVQGVIADVDNGDGTKTTTFYIDLPSTDPDDIITHTYASGYGDSAATDECLQFGDAPWFENQISAHESTQGTFRGLKIIAKTLSESDLKTEAASLDTNTMQTTDGINNVWYANVNPTPDDISDKSGQGNDPTWFDVNYKPTLYAPEPSTAGSSFVGATFLGGLVAMRRKRRNQ